MMKRAILVSAGTVAGLAAVLSYSGGQATIGADGPALGAPSGDGGDISGPTSPEPTASTTPAPGASTTPAPTSTPTKPAATPTASKPAAASASPARTTAKATPAPTKTTAKPAPAPTKPSGTFTGSIYSHRYGSVQVAIKVVNGAIVDAWAPKMPSSEESKPYTEYAGPILKQETIGAKSSSISTVSGATLTSNAWKQSLASAMSKAGL